MVRLHLLDFLPESSAFPFGERLPTVELLDDREDLLFFLPNVFLHRWREVEIRCLECLQFGMVLSVNASDLSDEALQCR